MEKRVRFALTFASNKAVELNTVNNKQEKELFFGHLRKVNWTDLQLSRLLSNGVQDVRTKFICLGIE